MGYPIPPPGDYPIRLVRNLRTELLALARSCNYWYWTHGAFPAQVAEQTLVLMRGQQDGAHALGPARCWVVVHVSTLRYSTLKTTHSPRTDICAHRNSMRVPLAMACNRIICTESNSAGGRGRVRVLPGSSHTEKNRFVRFGLEKTWTHSVSLHTLTNAQLWIRTFLTAEDKLTMMLMLPNNMAARRSKPPPESSGGEGHLPLSTEE